MNAFPNMTGQTGMNLRDYFAAKAMQAILTSGKWGPRTADQLHYDDDRESNLHTAGCLAQGAYEMADAMLEARKNESL
jgi:hypothetical protein